MALKRLYPLDVDLGRWAFLKAFSVRLRKRGQSAFLKLVKVGARRSFQVLLVRLVKEMVAVEGCEGGPGESSEEVSRDDRDVWRRGLLVSSKKDPSLRRIVETAKSLFSMASSMSSSRAS